MLNNFTRETKIEIVLVLLFYAFVLFDFPLLFSLPKLAPIFSFIYLFVFFGFIGFVYYALKSYHQICTKVYAHYENFKVPVLFIIWGLGLVQLALFIVANTTGFYPAYFFYLDNFLDDNYVLTTLIMIYLGFGFFEQKKNDHNIVSYGNYGIFALFFIVAAGMGSGDTCYILNESTFLWEEIRNKCNSPLNSDELSLISKENYFDSRMLTGVHYVGLVISLFFGYFLSIIKSKVWKKPAI